MLVLAMDYTVRQLARLAGVSVRTLHYYDRIGLLKPRQRNINGYRLYSEEAILPLQQILFFRELGFTLEEIKDIMGRPDFDAVSALESHRALLLKRAERLSDLIETVDRTIQQLQGEGDMDIRDYYKGFSDEQVEAYRQEVRERWGQDTLEKSEERVREMGKEGFAAVQAEGGAIFQAIADNMNKGPDSPEVQEQVTKWRQWLENFQSYSDEAVLGLGQMYSQDPRFAEFFSKYGEGFPAFLTEAIGQYCKNRE